MIPKKIIINIIRQFYYSKIDPRLRFIGVKDFSTELNCKKSLNLNQYLEDDILNCSSTVMFRGTPCSRVVKCVNLVMLVVSISPSSNLQSSWMTISRPPPPWSLGGQSLKTVIYGSIGHATNNYMSYKTCTILRFSFRTKNR